jgi:hypothetical protein
MAEMVKPRSESTPRPNRTISAIASGDIARTPRPVKVFGEIAGG